MRKPKPRADSSNVVPLQQPFKLDEAVRLYIEESGTIPHNGMSLEAAIAALLCCAEGGPLLHAEAAKVIAANYFRQQAKKLRADVCRADQDRIRDTALHAARIQGRPLSEADENGAFARAFLLIDRFGLRDRARLNCSEEKAVGDLHRWYYSKRRRKQPLRIDYKLLREMLACFGIVIPLPPDHLARFGIDNLVDVVRKLHSSPPAESVERL